MSPFGAIDVRAEKKDRGNDMEADAEMVCWSGRLARDNGQDFSLGDEIINLNSCTPSAVKVVDIASRTRKWTV